IRYFHVTGVQTCALPISAPSFLALPALRKPGRRTLFHYPAGRLETDSLLRRRPRRIVQPQKRFGRDYQRSWRKSGTGKSHERKRSEERRVGKEDRTRGEP